MGVAKDIGTEVLKMNGYGTKKAEAYTADGDDKQMNGKSAGMGATVLAGMISAIVSNITGFGGLQLEPPLPIDANDISKGNTKTKVSAKKTKKRKLAATGEIVEDFGIIDNTFDLSKPFS